MDTAHTEIRQKSKDQRFVIIKYNLTHAYIGSNNNNNNTDTPEQVMSIALTNEESLERVCN